MAKTIIEQLTELSEKATRYDNQRGRYVEYAKRLKAVALELIAVAKELDPYLNVNGKGRPKTKRKKSAKLKAIVPEVYGKMLQGAEMTSAILEKAYGIDARQSHYVLSKIKKQHKGVFKRTEGRNVTYYVQKTV